MSQSYSSDRWEEPTNKGTSFEQEWEEIVKKFENDNSVILASYDIGDVGGYQFPAGYKPKKANKDLTIFWLPASDEFSAGSEEMKEKRKIYQGENKCEDLMELIKKDVLPNSFFAGF